MNYEFKKPSELDIPLNMNRNQSMKHKPAVMYLNEAEPNTENFKFTESKAPNPYSATASPIAKDTSTEIPLNDGVVSVNTQSNGFPGTKGTNKKSEKQKLKAGYKDRLVSELEEVSHMLDSEENGGDENVDSSDIKGKLLDIDDNMFRDGEMHKVDLTGLLNEDDSTIKEEIEDAQNVRGVKLADKENNGNEDIVNENSGRKKNKFFQYAHKKSISEKHKKQSVKNEDDEDERLIKEILQKSNMLDEGGSNSKAPSNAHWRPSSKQFSKSPTVSVSNVKKTKKKLSSNDKCKGKGCGTLNDATIFKEPRPTRKPVDKQNRVEQQNKSTEDVTAKSEKNQKQEMKFKGLSPGNMKTVGRKSGEINLSKVTDASNSGNLKTHMAPPSKMGHLVNLSSSTLNEDYDLSVFSRGVAKSKHLVLPSPLGSIVQHHPDEITRKFSYCIFSPFDQHRLLS